MRRDVYILAALIAIVASPAFAQSARKTQTQRAPQVAPQYGCPGQKRYTDPDPNVSSS
jgi:hypothetical protein